MFVDTPALSCHGGAIAVYLGGEHLLENSRVYNNKANGDGMRRMDPRSHDLWAGPCTLGCC